MRQLSHQLLCQLLRQLSCELSRQLLRQPPCQLLRQLSRQPACQLSRQPACQLSRQLLRQLLRQLSSSAYIEKVTRMFWGADYYFTTHLPRIDESILTRQFWGGIILGKEQEVNKLTLGRATFDESLLASSIFWLETWVGGKISRDRFGETILVFLARPLWLSTFGKASFMRWFWRDAYGRAYLGGRWECWGEIEGNYSQEDSAEEPQLFAFQIWISLSPFWRIFDEIPWRLENLGMGFRKYLALPPFSRS